VRSISGAKAFSRATYQPRDGKLSGANIAADRGDAFAASGRAGLLVR